MKIILACERSGGHLFPALTLAERIRAANDKVFLFVTAGFLKKIVKERGVSAIGIALPFRNIFFEGMFRFLEAFVLLLKIRPNKVIGFGGRDSFLLLVLARLFFISTAIYEPNISPGKANILLSKIVQKTYCGFEETLPLLSRTELAGIPVRCGFKRYDHKSACLKLGLNENKKVILVLGGSQGARFINDLFIEILPQLKDRYQIVHLTGLKDYPRLKEIYSTIKTEFFVKGFVLDLDILYSAADIAVCRAGAITLAELIYFNLPALLIPHPSAGSHQSRNAGYLVSNQAGIMMEQKDIDRLDFSSFIIKLADDEGKLSVIKNNLAKLKLIVSCDEFYEKIFWS
ncbi:MAG: UDP-N-acetylglucosamine--N-acetylmuramyl-(pentapeptide) pyrophosphoryl-undecaprenol N-acetylglucosamine transferase [Candidatus Omnitrophica bacterium]|nr:UDP-N-acetylglucosamine--N-acetylmuramyl-(pentapeptide) pyrophosphoryl-undecaprenol N-acetylglucosamine transferase [Candidatus Omnitrophota bacterium]